MMKYGKYIILGVLTLSMPLNAKIKQKQAPLNPVSVDKQRALATSHQSIAIIVNQAANKLKRQSNARGVLSVLNELYLNLNKANIVAIPKTTTLSEINKFYPQTSLATPYKSLVDFMALLHSKVSTSKFAKLSMSNAYFRNEDVKGGKELGALIKLLEEFYNVGDITKSLLYKVSKKFIGSANIKPEELPGYQQADQYIRNIAEKIADTVDLVIMPKDIGLNY